MGKYADRHYLTDATCIVEEGFDPAYAEVSESVFSLANEYMGVRGYFEEGYSGKGLQGSYFNGIYEYAPTVGSAYRGIASGTEYMVNSADWLCTSIVCGTEHLDLAESVISDYRRILDMKSGLLTRSFVWHLKDGRILKVCFERLVAMKSVTRGAQRIVIESQTGETPVTVTTGISFETVHRSAGETRWITDGATAGDSSLGATIRIWGHTVKTGMKLDCMAETSVSLTSCTGETVGDGDIRTAVDADKDKGRVSFTVNAVVGQGSSLTVEKSVSNLADKPGQLIDETECPDGRNCSFSFSDVLGDNIRYWTDVWNRADIVIDGDPEDQQGIRFCIFQMFQTYHGAVPGTNIGAKGLTGEAYNGNAFWDTETYCLPFYLWNDRQAAVNLLKFRYRTLDEARRRAEALDCRGAFYPIATISGKECCNLWQHASLQLQASTAVAYGIWLYEKLYNDEQFLLECGLEMLIEISRMLASRGAFDPDGNYGFYGVMGPDEFQMMVNNNCYTNYMGRETLEYTLECLKKPAMKTAAEGFGVTSDETALWERICSHMIIPLDKATGIYEQHDGYFKLPHVDVAAIPAEDFPLYEHWSYDRIYRNDMIKQPDVLMMMLLHNADFTEEELRKNYEFYEPRCIHESSLSPSVHSIIAAQLGRSEEAYRFFGFATRMDLDNYNRNTGEGIHTTSIAAAWMNIVYGFGGLRADGDKIGLAPTLPKRWKGYSFKLNHGDWALQVKVTFDRVILTLEGDVRPELALYGRPVVWDEQGQYTEVLKR